MLKNKEQRRNYLLDNANWQIVMNDPELHITFRSLILPDGNKVLREDVLENDEFQVSCVQIRKTIISSRYRIIRQTYVTHELSITFLIDYLSKV